MRTPPAIRNAVALLALVNLLAACGGPATTVAPAPTTEGPAAKATVAVAATATVAQPTRAPATAAALTEIPSEAPTDTPAPTNTPAPTAPPAPRPDQLRVAILALVTLDPIGSFNVEQVVLGNVCERLLDHNPPGSAEPFTYKLATRLTPRADGLTWTAALRPGVQFHDGTPFDAAAVAATIAAVQDHGALPSLYRAVSSIDTPDDLTVVFHLSAPVDLALILAGPYGTQIVSSAALAAAAADPQAFSGGLDGCTGPYSITSATSTSVELALFAGYWNPVDLPGRPAKVQVQVVAPADQPALLTSQQIDLALSMSKPDTAALNGNPHFALVTDRTYQSTVLFLNELHAPLDELAVRQAIAAAIDTPALIEQLIAANGVAVYPSHGPLPDGLFPASTEVPPNLPDVAAAQALLAGAGHTQLFSLRLLYNSTDPAAAVTIPLITQSLAAIGVTVELQGLSGLELVKVLNAPDLADRPDLFLGQSLPFQLDGAAEILVPFYHSGEAGSRNLSAYNNPAFDALVDAAQAEVMTNPSAAQEKFLQAQQLVVAEAPAVFLYTTSVSYAVPNYLLGFNHTPDYWNYVDFYQIHYQN